VRPALKVTVLIALLFLALTFALLARARGRMHRFERARIDRVEDATTPMQRALFTKGCSSVRVVPLNESLKVGPHPAGAQWIECWSTESDCRALIERLAVASWADRSIVQLNGPNGRSCVFQLEDGAAVGGPEMIIMHAPTQRPVVRIKTFVRALFQ
jgi:hypothetical protein